MVSVNDLFCSAADIIGYINKLILEEKNMLPCNNFVKQVLVLLFLMFITSNCNPNKCTKEYILESIENNLIENIENCLNADIEINYKDKNGNSFLTLAVKNGNLDVINLLILNNADLFVFGGDEESLVNLARASKKESIIKELKLRQFEQWERSKEHFSEKYFSLAIKHDNDLIIQKFLDEEILANTILIDGLLPVVAAVFQDSQDVVRLLIKEGADVNSEFDTRAILLIAAMYGYENIVQTLIAAGADINNYEGAHTTALMFAAENNYSEIVKKLLSAGADPNFVNKNNETALDQARKKGHKQVAEILSGIK